MLFSKKITWKTPTGTYSKAIERALSNAHILIGGTTGAGKSVLIDNILYYLLLKGNSEFVLIDPKEVQLKRYTYTPLANIHAITPAGIENALQRCADLMDKRFTDMRKAGTVETSEKDLYIIIDEFIDVKLLCKKTALDNLTRIIVKGRAAHIHVILATQRPTRDILPGTIRANFPAVIALRCANVQESRNLLNVPDAAELPKNGVAILKDPDGIAKFKVDYIPDKVQFAIDFWKNQFDNVPRWKWPRCIEQ